MSELDKTVYRTTNADVLKRWHDTNAAVTEWAKTLEIALEEMGVGGRMAFYDQVSGRVIGVAAHGGPIPEGWRRDRSHDRIVPARSTKPGKAIGARLDALRRPEVRDLPGMPKHAMPGLCLLTVGLEEIDGVVYAKWSRPISEDEVDLAVWERVKLSEYFRVLEEQQERGEAVSSL